MEGETWVASKVRSLARAGHGPEAQLTIRKLALDAGDARRPVGAQCRYGLVAARSEEPPHARREVRLPLLDLTPCNHRTTVPERGFTCGTARRTRVRFAARRWH
jgi:hypothetical protein